jgi:hypothetical protein
MRRVALSNKSTIFEGTKDSLSTSRPESVGAVHGLETLVECSRGTLAPTAGG